MQNTEYSVARSKSWKRTLQRTISLYIEHMAAIVFCFASICTSNGSNKIVVSQQTHKVFFPSLKFAPHTLHPFSLTNYMHICVIQLSACDVTSSNVLGTSRKGCTREVVGFQHWARGTWLLLCLAVESPCSCSTEWAISLLLCRFRKRSSGHVGPPFLAIFLL